jgi:hypothetical protein
VGKPAREPSRVHLSAATPATTALSPSAGSPLGAEHRTVPAPDTFRNHGKASGPVQKRLATSQCESASG